MVHKKTLVCLFEKYYSEPCEENLIELLSGLFHYEFEDYRADMDKVFELYCLCQRTNEFIKMKSNGSTGQKNEYYFGPNASKCIVEIESHLRDRGTKTILAFCPAPESKCICRKKVEVEKVTHREDVCAVGDWFLDSHIKMLIGLIEEKYQDWGALNLLGLPNVWMMLSTNKDFRDWIKKNKHKINFIVNSDWDFCSKTMDVPVRDQMIDWKTGFNFYTCRHGTYHFLPIFMKKQDKVFNLLNLTKIGNNLDDQFGIGSETKMCRCGKKYLELDFSTHYAHKVVNKDGNCVNFKDLYDRLNCTYRNLQMHQNPNGLLTVYYSSDSDDDMPIFLGFFKEKGIEKTLFRKNRYFKIGNKRYCSWRSERVDEKYFFEKKRGLL